MKLILHLFSLSLSLFGICHALQPVQPRPSAVTSATRLSAPSALFGQHQHRRQESWKDTRLFDTSSEPSLNAQKLDVKALGKYALALGTQMGLFYAIFQGADFLLDAAGAKVPFAINCVLFWFVALKSRVLNPLENSRPKTDNLETGSEQRKLPSWTPPGVFFPIMWVLIIGPIRAATTAMVYQVTGSYANTAILSLMLHLSIGDVWNTINNVERRYGASVIGVLLVWLSKANAAYQYYQVAPRPGQLLCLPLIWLTIASALVTRTWQINPDLDTGKPYPLYPVEGQGQTVFKWFS